ncbi:MAG: SCO family protein [Myxococcales bacterium]|nr:SCO family protein [Myxococcales bacterium]
MSSRMALLLVAFACALWTRSAAAQPTAQLDRELQGIEVVDRIGAALPAELELTDHEGERVRLGDFAGHPVLLTFNYSTCPMLCSLQLGGLAKALAAMGELPPDVRIVRISLAPKETPEQAAKGQLAYVRQAGGSEAAARAWRFLVGDERTIRAAADAVGFRYRYRPESGDYLHVAALFVITADGHLSSLFGGIEYDAKALAAALERARQNQLQPVPGASPLDVVLSCFNYDATGHSPTALVAMRIAGLVLLAGLATFWIVLVLRKKSKRAREASVTAH